MPICSKCNENKDIDRFALRENNTLRKQCKDCTNAQAKKRYSENPAYFRDRHEKWRNTETGKESKKRASERYRKENKEKTRALIREHYKRNKPMYRAKDAQRRANQLNATPKWIDRQYIRDLYANAKEATELFQSIGLTFRFEVDHIVPLVHKKVCGLHTEDNLQILPCFLNRKKSNKFLVG